MCACDGTQDRREDEDGLGLAGLGAAPEGALKTRRKAAVKDATASPNNERICPKDTRS